VVKSNHTIVWWPICSAQLSLVMTDPFASNVNTTSLFKKVLIANKPFQLPKKKKHYWVYLYTFFLCTMNIQRKKWGLTALFSSEHSSVYLARIRLQEATFSAKPRILPEAASNALFNFCWIPFVHYFCSNSLRSYNEK